MKIDSRFRILPEATSGPASRGPQAPTEPFGALLKERCQEAGAASPTAAAKAVELANSVLNMLERISSQLVSGASAREMALAHEQLARLAQRLRQTAEGLEPGTLKTVLSETAALGYLQLWRFEQGDFL